jgi:DNA polymerase-1
VLAAAYAEDQAELDTYYSGRDLYLDIAIRLGLAPAGADHKVEPDLVKRKAYAKLRKKMKTMALGLQYMQGFRALATRLGLSELEAEVIVSDVKRLRQKYWDWSDAQIKAARKRGSIETIFGWRMYCYPQVRRGKSTVGTKTTTLGNYPIQSAGGEVMRVSSVLLEHGGFGERMCTPHHDAHYAFAPASQALEVAAAIEAAFGKAGDIVMNGKARLLMDTGFYPHPCCYEDEDGADLFEIVDEFLSGLPDVTDEEWAILQAEMKARIAVNRRNKKGHKKVI